MVSEYKTAGSMNQYTSLKAGDSVDVFHHRTPVGVKIESGKFCIISVSSAVAGPGYYGTVQDAEGNVKHGYVYPRNRCEG